MRSADVRVMTVMIMATTIMVIMLAMTMLVAAVLLLLMMMMMIPMMITMDFQKAIICGPGGRNSGMHLQAEWWWPSSCRHRWR